MFKRFLDPLMLNTLTVEAGRIAEQARKNASWSSKIPGAISVTPAQIEGDGRYTISIVVDLSKEHGAPMAAAFEYGSGEHGKDRKRYKIAPNEADHLAFPVERWPNYVPPPNVSFASFPGPISNKPYVMHPGVAPRPYLKPAIENYKPTLKARLANVFKRGLLDGIHVEFKEIKT